MDNNIINQQDKLLNPNKREIISWSENYSTGIELVDNQHKELVNLTNELYRACRSGSSRAEAVFKDAMSRMVDYVRFHFSTEQMIFDLIKYPDAKEHKKQHDTMVMNILDAVKEFSKGSKFVPHNFVRTLKDWILSHIAVYDKAYSTYILTQRKNGTLNEDHLRG